MFKSAIDSIAKRKVRDMILKSAKEKGMDLEERMTDNINDKLDELMQAIIDDIGYKDLAKMGLNIQ